MNRKSLALILFLILSIPFNALSKSTQTERIIFDTDMGNDVDDALAIDMLYKYSDLKKVKILAVMLSQEGRESAEYVNILNTWYGYRHIPIGIIRNGARQLDVKNYVKTVCKMNDSEGKTLFKRSIKDYSKLPDAHILYRKILAKQPDNSVTIIATGFPTNLERLLETGPNKYSKLSGRELVSRKVTRLVMMAGNMKNPNYHEFYVVTDVKAAKTVFETWPTPLVTSPFEVGNAIRYPASSILNDFKWTSHHPVVEAYKAYMKMPYDRQTWDLTAVLYAVEGTKWFDISRNGLIKVDDKVGTQFIANAVGNRQYLILQPNQTDSIKAHFVKLITKRPLHHKL